MYQKTAAVTGFLLVVVGLASAGFTGSDAGSTAVEGEIRVDAQAADGFFEKLAARANPLSFIESVSSDSVQQGGTLHVSVGDVVDTACQDTVFVVEAYAPEPPSDRDYEARTLDHLTEYDPVGKDTLVSADVELTMPDDAEPGQWTLIAYTYCYETNEIIGGTSSVAEHTFTVKEVSDGGASDDTTTQNPDLQLVRQPTVTADGTTVTGQVELQNTGGAMQTSRLVEMQVRPAGQGPLSFISQRRLCDPSHPENVHRAFRLGQGDHRTITLRATDLEPDTAYDVYFMTGTDCAVNGGEPTPPYRSPELAGTVCTGDCTDVTDTLPDTETMVLLGGGGLIIVGGVIYLGLL
jgi:hypothetical protein